MTTLRMGSKTWIYLNSSRVVAEIISKRGNITDERPFMPVSAGLVSRFKRTVLRKTAQWTEGRRVMHRLLNGTILETYAEWQETESVQLLAACLYRPRNWYSHHFRYAVSVMNQIVFGKRLVKSTQDLNIFLRAGLQFIHSMYASTIDFFPWISYLPEPLWRGAWARMGQDHFNIYLTWWKPIKQAVMNGTAPASFTRDILLHKDTGYKGNDEDAMYLSTSIVGGGSDNPRKVLNTFVMAALCHPSTIVEARDEIDAVCGRRLPIMRDMDSMPYVCAFIKELLRWRPSVLMIPPHDLTQDLHFEGYDIPKGTSFFINPVSISEECDDHEAFIPKRWLNEHVQSITHGLWQFGGGRRICPGYKVAQQGLFIAIARLIYCFEYTPVRIDVL